MKRIAFAAAAALLGTGCITHTETVNEVPVQYGSVNVYWSFVRAAPAQASGHLEYDTTYVGTPNTACQQSAVEAVTIDSPVSSLTVDCVTQGQGGAGVQGVGIDAIPAGTRSFRLRGWRGCNGTTCTDLVYDTTASLDVHPNMTMDYYVPVQGVSAPLDLYARFNFGGGFLATCAQATPAGSSVPPNVAWEIRDALGNIVDQDLVGCAGALPAPVLVGGDLELDNYSVRMRGLRAEDSALVFDSCDVALDHFSPQTGASAPAPILWNPVPACN